MTTKKQNKKNHGIFMELPDYTSGRGSVPGTGENSAALSTSNTSIRRGVTRPSGANPASLPTGQTSIVRGNGGIGAANLGTFGSRTMASSGDAIGSGTVRGDGPMPVAPVGRTSTRTGAASPRMGTPAGQLNAVRKGMSRTNIGVAAVPQPSIAPMSGPTSGVNYTKTPVAPMGVPAVSARPPVVDAAPRRVGAWDSEGFAGPTTQHGFGRSNCKF